MVGVFWRFDGLREFVGQRGSFDWFPKFSEWGVQYGVNSCNFHYSCGSRCVLLYLAVWKIVSGNLMTGVTIKEFFERSVTFLNWKPRFLPPVGLDWNVNLILSVLSKSSDFV